jgi:hypothetical protein
MRPSRRAACVGAEGVVEALARRRQIDLELVVLGLERLVALAKRVVAPLERLEFFALHRGARGEQNQEGNDPLETHA